MTSEDTSFARRIWSLLPWLFLGLIIFAIFSLGKQVAEKKSHLAQEKEQANPAELPLVNVVVQKLALQPMADIIKLPALTKAWESLTIQAEIDGQLTQILVKEGDTVSKGDQIALIDPRDYELAVQSIQAKYDLAKTNFTRLEKLNKSQAISQAAYDEAYALLRELEAELANAKHRLSKTAILAPMGGVVDALPAKIGLLVSFGDPIATVLDIDRLKVDVAIPETDIAAIRKLDSCDLIFSSLDNKVARATLYYLGKTPVTNSMVYPLQLKLPNPDHELLPGMFSMAHLVKKRLDQTLGIPLYAILNDGQQQFVYIIQDQIAEKRFVKTGFLQDWQVQIIKGLSPGERVAIVGHRSLEDGQRVRIVKEVLNAGELYQ